MITCVIPHRLYRSSRPGRFDEGVDARNVASATVDLWIRAVHQQGIRRVLCLLDEAQLAFYSQVPGGLLAYYRRHGLEVTSLPTTDHIPVPHRTLTEAATWFAAEVSSSLIHCSAGIERTGAVIDHLLAIESARHP
jgi:protein tyrosine/serine phosphatase